MAASVEGKHDPWLAVVALACNGKRIDCSICICDHPLWSCLRKGREYNVDHAQNCFRISARWRGKLSGQEAVFGHDDLNRAHDPSIRRQGGKNMFDCHIGCCHGRRQSNVYRTGALRSRACEIKNHCVTFDFKSDFDLERLIIDPVVIQVIFCFPATIWQLRQL